MFDNKVPNSVFSVLTLVSQKQFKFKPCFGKLSMTRRAINMCIVSPHYSKVSYLQTFLLTKICHPQIYSLSAFMVICRHAQKSKNLRLIMDTFPTNVEVDVNLLSYFSSHIINKCPFCGLLSVIFCTFVLFGNFTI